MSIRHRIEALAQLLDRYRTGFVFHWRQRDKLSPPALHVVEAEFLPAALAIQHRPVSPLGRAVAAILVGIVVFTVLWSILGHVDIIVNGQGKIIPSGYTKTISSSEIGSVRRLYVSEGQFVHAGDPVIDLDTRMTLDERAKARAEWQDGTLEAARSRALIRALDSDRSPKLPAISGVVLADWLDTRAHLNGQWQDFEAKRDRLREQVRDYSEALPLAITIARNYAALAKTNDVSQQSAMEKEQARIDAQEKLDDARSQLAMLIADTRKSAQDDLEQGSRVADEALADEQRAQAHADLLTLRSPVDGTVQQLQVHTVGSAVPAAQPLMQIVPKDMTVRMEAFIADRDVGFVREGQGAQVKIDTFEYTKYGTIPAIVTHVSRDAIQDDKKNLRYSVQVRLLRPTIEVDGLMRKLEPGMSGTVEIKTGSRRVIEYVLSPLIKNVTESLHER